MTILETDHLTREVEDAHIIDDVTVDVRKGKVLVIVGPSGCYRFPSFPRHYVDSWPDGRDAPVWREPDLCGDPPVCDYFHHLLILRANGADLEPSDSW